MKRYMKIREYCKETGFPEETMRALVKSYKGHKFSQRLSDADNSHYLITVPVFEKMWDSGELRECL